MRVVIGWVSVKRLLRLNVRKPTGGSRSRAEAVPRRRQRPRPLSANTFWVGRRDDGNAGPTQRLDCILRTAGNGAEPKPISVLGGIRFCPIPLNKSWFEGLRLRGSEVATMFVSCAAP